MEEIPLDTLGNDEYTDYCEVVSSDEESSDEDRFLEITVSTSDEYSATRGRFVSLDVDIPITEEQMNELRNATSSTGMSDDYSCNRCGSTCMCNPYEDFNSDEESETFTPEVMDWYSRILQSRDELPHTRVVRMPRPAPYYLPLKTLDQYDEITAREESNGKGYNRTFIG